MKSKRRPVGVGVVAAVVAMLAMSVGASAAFGFSTFAFEGGSNPAGIEFSGEGGAVTLQAAGGNKVTCEKSTLSNGRFESIGGPEAEASLTFSGKCELSAETPVKLSEECPTIKTGKLSLLAGEISAGSERGLLLESGNGTLAEFTCASRYKVVVTGTLICESKGAFVRKLGREGELVCAEGGLGDQLYTQIEVAGKTLTEQTLKAEATLGIFKKAESDALVMTDALKFSKPVEQT